VPAENVLEIVILEKYIDAPAPAHIHTKNNRISSHLPYQMKTLTFRHAENIIFAFKRHPKKEEEIFAYLKHPQLRGERPKPPLSIWWLSSWSGVDGSEHNLS